MLISNGGYEFEFIDGFDGAGETPKLGYTHGVVVDSSDNVFVFNQSPNAVIKFDRHGAMQQTWGEEFQQGAHGMFLANEPDGEFLYLTDYVRNLVVKTTTGGQQQFALTVPDSTGLYRTLEQFKPTDVCTAPSGEVYVFDGYGKSFVHIFDHKGKYQSSFGGDSTKDDNLNCPHGGWVDTRKAVPELYVADRGHHRIAVFTLDGKFKREITDPRMTRPCNFYGFGDDLYISDLDARLLILNRDDKVVAVLGEDPEAPKQPGWPNIQSYIKPGKFSSPHALTVDSRGDVYVVEWINTGRIVKLVRRGTDTGTANA